MEIARRKTRSDRSQDAGFTLIEVLAAVIIIVIVALSGAGLTIRGINAAAAQEREQVAVTIANGAMENVSGKLVANLYAGRCKVDVTNAFTANSSKPGVSATYPTWDPTVSTTASCGCSTSVSVPVTLVAPSTGSAPCNFPVQNATKYTLTTLIGTCYERTTGGTCNVITGQTVGPSGALATTPAGYAALVRVMVLVSWTGGGSCSVAVPCYYEATTLADPNADLVWTSP